MGVEVLVRAGASAGVAEQERVHSARAHLLRHRPQQTPVWLSPATTEAASVHYSLINTIIVISFQKNVNIAYLDKSYSLL